MEPTRELKQAVIDYKNGKADAFATLYEESQRYVYVCICKIIGDCDNLPEVVSDLMQDTYAEIGRHISQLEKVDSFLNWAGSIATRQCYAYLKKNRKYVLFSKDNALEKLTAEEELIPETIMQDREKQRLIRKIIDTELTPMQRICIIAYYYNEQKQSEIARDLGIPENTVKTHLSRAKSKIKEGVLQLEKNEDTRLYSVAPFLLLLLNEEIRECVVPSRIAKRILSGGNADAISAAGAGTKDTATAGKMGAAANKGVEASLKIKIAAALIGVGALLAVGCNIIQGQGDQSRVPDRRQEKESDSQTKLASGEKVDGNTDISEGTNSKTGLISEDYFEWDGNIITGLSDSGAKQKTLVIPARCEGFSPGIFAIKENEVTTVSFESNKDIRLNGVFRSASDLISISLPEDLTEISVKEFWVCSSLKEITIPKNVTEIGPYAFEDCENLTTVVFESSTTSIPAHAFDYCQSLTSIVLPDSITRIEEYAFWTCVSLESITLPASLTEVEKYAFLKTGLTTITVPEEVTLTEYDTTAFIQNHLVTVYVTQGSWMDENFESVFVGQFEKKYSIDSSLP